MGPPEAEAEAEAEVEAVAEAVVAVGREAPGTEARPEAVE
jgi:hypothetical protein